MLVLTRKTNESVYIDDQIEVLVVAVRGNKVKLGFRAPANVTIQRGERAARELNESPRIFEEADDCGEDSKNDLVALFFEGARMRLRPR
jgi:carbon storage regulator CsrA